MFYVAKIHLFHFTIDHTSPSIHLCPLLIGLEVCPAVCSDPLLSAWQCGSINFEAWAKNSMCEAKGWRKRERKSKPFELSQRNKRL